MARHARIVVPGVAHHVTQRGNNRQDIFFVDDDRRVFLRFLKESAKQYDLSVSVYCLMRNHVHLIAIPEQENSLSKALGRTHLMYAQYVHKLHGRSGHFWQSRFYSCPLDEDYAQNAAAYVELNPVRARMHRMAWKYPWSSAAYHCGLGGDPSGLLNLGERFADMPPARWKRTLTNIADDDESMDSIRTHTRTGQPLGSDTFLSKLETILGRRVRSRLRGRPVGSKDTVKRTRRKKEE